MTWTAARPFTAEENATILQMLAAGKSQSAICEALGRGKSSVHSRIEKLRRSGHFNPTYVRREDLEPARTCELKAPLSLGSGDARYIALCLAQGGFASCTQLDTGRFVFGHAGKAWVQP